MPDAALGVVHQQPVLFAARVPQVQVIPLPHTPRRRPVHALQLLLVQRRRDLHRQAPVPQHHAVIAQVIKRLVQNTQAAPGIRRHAPAPHAAHAEVARLCAVQLVQDVLLKKQYIPHAACRAGKRALAAHAHRVAVRRRALIAVPVGCITQLAGVNAVLCGAAAPYPVVLHRHKIQLRHPPLYLHAVCLPVKLLPRAAVHAAPHRPVLRHGQGSVVHRAVLVGRNGHHQRVLLRAHQLYLALQRLPQRVQHRARHPGHGHCIPRPESLSHAAALHPAAVQQHLLPALRPLVVDLHHALLPPRQRCILLQPHHPVGLFARLLGAAMVCGVGLACRVAGHQPQLRLALAPAVLHLGQRPRLGVKHLLVRPDQHPAPHAHHLLPAPAQRIRQHRLHPVAPGVLQRATDAQQQPVQIIRALHILFLPHLFPQPPGLQCRVSPAGKIHALAQLRLAAPVGLV